MEFKEIIHMRGKKNAGETLYPEIRTFEECKKVCETRKNECLGISWTGKSCSLIQGASHWEESSDNHVRSFISVPNIRPSRMHTMALFIAELLLVISIAWILIGRNHHK
jgi:hypothetical protein